MVVSVLARDLVYGIALSSLGVYSHLVASDAAQAVVFDPNFAEMASLVPDTPPFARHSTFEYAVIVNLSQIDFPAASTSSRPLVAVPTPWTVA